MTIKTTREAAGHYVYTCGERSVTVKLNEGDKSDGVAPFWMTIVDGEFDNDFTTKRDAVDAAKRILKAA